MSLRLAFALVLVFCFFQNTKELEKLTLSGETYYEDTWYIWNVILWMDCRVNDYDNGAITGFAGSYTGSWYDEFDAYIYMYCVYNDNSSSTTPPPLDADDPILPQQTYTGSSDSYYCSMNEYYFGYCKTGKITCDTDYAIMEMHMRHMDNYFWYDYTCVAVKSTAETTTQYQEYSPEITGYQDSVNWQVFASKSLSFTNERIALRGVQFDFYDRTDNYRITQKMRYVYETITLRNMKTVKAAYLNDTDYLVRNYEKDT